MFVEDFSTEQDYLIPEPFVSERETLHVMTTPGLAVRRMENWPQGPEAWAVSPNEKVNYNTGGASPPLSTGTDHVQGQLPLQVRHY